VPFYNTDLYTNSSSLPYDESNLKYALHFCRVTTKVPYKEFFILCVYFTEAYFLIKRYKQTLTSLQTRLLLFTVVYKRLAKAWFAIFRPLLRSLRGKRDAKFLLHTLHHKNMSIVSKVSGSSWKCKVDILHVRIGKNVHKTEKIFVKISLVKQSFQFFIKKQDFWRDKGF